MHQEVNGAEAHENPVMRAVFENIKERHRVVREAMNEQGLQFALRVMSNDHGEAKLLVERVRLAFPVNLLWECHQQHSNQDRPKILNQENKFPRYLQAQVLVDEVQGAGADFVGSQKFREQLPLIAQGFSFRVANRESDSIDINVSQIWI